MQKQNSLGPQPLKHTDRAIAKDDSLFAQVAVDPELGTITWPNGVDLDPDVLHGDYEATQPWKQPHH